MNSIFEGSVYHFSTEKNTWVQPIYQDNLITVKAEDPLKDETEDDKLTKGSSDPFVTCLKNKSPSRKQNFGENFVIFEKQDENMLENKARLKV